MFKLNKVEHKTIKNNWLLFFIFYFDVSKHFHIHNFASFPKKNYKYDKFTIKENLIIIKVDDLDNAQF